MTGTGKGKLAGVVLVLSLMALILLLALNAPAYVDQFPGRAAMMPGNNPPAGKSGASPTLAGASFLLLVGAMAAFLAYRIRRRKK